MTIPIISWNNRENATTKQGAVAALSDFTSSSYGIRLLMDQPNTPRVRSALLEVKAYADKWEIPFSISMLRETMSMMKRKRFGMDTNVPEPMPRDFPSYAEYSVAYHTWRDASDVHIWVSSTERC